MDGSGLVSADKFREMYEIPVDKWIEQKNGLDYLPWHIAVMLLKEHFPSFEVRFLEDEETPKITAYGDKTSGYYCMPYIHDLATGVKSSPLFYPVMDFKNKSILTPTTCDINKSRMRALVKAIAMYTGLGLVLFTQEDIEQTKDLEALRAKIIEASNRHDISGLKPAGIQTLSNLSSVDSITTLQRLLDRIQELPVKKLQVPV